MDAASLYSSDGGTHSSIRTGNLHMAVCQLSGGSQDSRVSDFAASR
jgi:hypothetical protein